MRILLIENYDHCFFVIMIRRIFPSLELAPTHSTIVTRGLSIHLISFINVVSFSSQLRAIVFI